MWMDEMVSCCFILKGILVCNLSICVCDFQEVGFTLCLDTVGGAEDSLFLHVSKPPKPGTPAHDFLTVSYISFSFQMLQRMCKICYSCVIKTSLGQMESEDGTGLFESIKRKGGIFQSSSLHIIFSGFGGCSRAPVPERECERRPPEDQPECRAAAVGAPASEPASHPCIHPLWPPGESHDRMLSSPRPQGLTHESGFRGR